MTRDNLSGGNIKQAPERRKQKVPKKITESYLHNAGLYYLQRFSASSEHFHSVMMRKVKKSCAHHQDQDFEACTRLVDQLVQKFLETGLLNDEAYVSGMIASGRRKGLSRKAILNKLRQKSVSPDTALPVLEAHDEERTAQAEEINDADFGAALTFVRRRKIGPYRKPKHGQNAEDFEIFQKELAKCARAGFSFEISRKVLELDQDEAERLAHDYAGLVS